MNFWSFLFKTKRRDNETQVEDDESDTYVHSEVDTPERRRSSTPKKNNTPELNMPDVSMIEGREDIYTPNSDTTNGSTRVFSPTPRHETLSPLTDEGYNTGSSNERYRPSTPYPKSVHFEKQPKFYSPGDSVKNRTYATESGESFNSSSTDEKDRRYLSEIVETSYSPINKNQSKGYVPDIEEDYFVGNRDRHHRTLSYSDNTDKTTLGSKSFVRPRTRINNSPACNQETEVNFVEERMKTPTLTSVSQKCHFGGETSPNSSSKFSPPSFVYVPDDYYKIDGTRELSGYMKEEDNTEPNPFFSQSFSSMTRRRKEKEPAKYDGKTDLTDYLCHFGKVAKRNGWAYTDCGLELATSLIGDARSVLSDLPKAKEDDYLTLVETLIQRFDPEGRESKYSSDFLERCCGPKEDLNEYGHQLRKLARKAYPGLVIPDQIMIDVFIKGLPEEDMIKHVSLAQPQTLEEAIQIAIRCDTFKKRRKQLKEANYYNYNTPHRAFGNPEPQHRIPSVRPQGTNMANENKSVVTPAYSQRVGLQNEKKNEAIKNPPATHPPNTPNQPASNDRGMLAPPDTPWSGPRPPVICYNCQQPGHIAVNCPD